jgi:hypothetical protein
MCTKINIYNSKVSACSVSNAFLPRHSLSSKKWRQDPQDLGLGSAIDREGGPEIIGCAVVFCATSPTGKGDWSSCRKHLSRVIKRQGAKIMVGVPRQPSRQSANGVSVQRKDGSEHGAC